MSLIRRSILRGANLMNYGRDHRSVSERRCVMIAQELRQTDLPRICFA